MYELILFLTDAYPIEYVRLYWMDPAIEKSPDGMHITDYNDVKFTQFKELHLGGDFNRKFTYSSFFFLLLVYLCPAGC